jgi:hypothetical protein
MNLLGFCPLDSRRKNMLPKPGEFSRVKFKPRTSCPAFPPLQPPVWLMDHEHSYNPSYRESLTGYETRWVWAPQLRAC